MGDLQTTVHPSEKYTAKYHTTEPNRIRRKSNLYDLARDQFHCISAIPKIQGDKPYLTRTSELGGASGIDHIMIPKTAYSGDPKQNRLLAGAVDLEIGHMYLSSDHYPCYVDMTFNYTFTSYPETKYKRRRFRANPKSQ